jgi:hypothetical protein
MFTRALLKDWMLEADAFETAATVATILSVPRMFVYTYALWMESMQM